MKKPEIIEVIPTKKITVGNEDAPITLMEFGDYESVECAKANEVVKAILDAYPQEVKFMFRHFPLLKFHQKAHKAAEASLAAAQEGKFWEMHNELFANRHSLGTISLKGHARDVGVKSKKFLEDLINGFYGIYVQDDLKEGMRMGVKNVPTFFVNGKLVEGEPTYKNIATCIEEVLKTKKTKAVKKAA